MTTIPDAVLKQLAEKAWSVRENAVIIGRTRVGCAVLSADGRIFAGCNVEQVFRSHDIHAEVNAIGNMVAAGERRCLAVFIAAERERFTPCGACMDWIMQFGTSDCFVIFQGELNGAVHEYTAQQLMPYYPN